MNTYFCHTIKTKIVYTGLTNGLLNLSYCKLKVKSLLGISINWSILLSV